MSAVVVASPETIPTGLPIGRVRSGTRLCQLYRTQDELLEFLVPYFEAGLLNHERCIWITAGTLTSEHARTALGERVADLDERLAADQIQIIDHAAWTRACRNEADSVSGWLERGRLAARDGYAGLRITDPVEYLEPDPHRRSGYETRAHRGFLDNRIVAVCSYSLERCTSDEILDALRSHGSVLVCRAGGVVAGWEEVRSATAVLALIEPVRQLRSRGHSVELFETASFPAHSIAHRLISALAQGAGAGALATHAHLVAIRDEIARHVDVEALVASGQLLLLETTELYDALVASPDDHDTVLDTQLAVHARTLTRRFGRATLYGELVDVFCSAGDYPGAIRLERWWNRQLITLPITLHCGYSVESFHDTECLGAYRDICSEHGEVVPRGNDPHRKAEPQRVAAELEQVSAILDLETARRAAFGAYEGSRIAEEQLRIHLMILQRVTSALCESVTHADIGRVVTELARTLDATRIGLVIRGELITLHGVTTPEDPTAVGTALDAMPASWSSRANVPPELAWLGSRLTAVVPLTVSPARDRIGTLVLGFERGSDDSTERALLDDLARQIAIAADRACSFERAEREREGARVASAAKDHFMAVLGHELRNPLSPIVTATQLMRLRAPESLAKERTTIERSVGTLMKLIDDLLDVSRIERGELDLVRAPVELAELVTQAIELTSGMIQDRGHRVHVAVEPGLVVDGDRQRLTQVITALLANAAKFTRPAGSISITGRLVGETVELDVTDNGIGIPPDLRAHVFELFVQAPPSVVRSKGGLGIGLAIAHEVIAKHGGTISAESEGTDKGSQFTVRLPRWVSPASKLAPPAPEPETSGQRILVVDDNEDAAWLLAEALRLAGHDVCVSHDGVSALELARTWNPQIAFLDVGLPGMDGYMLCQHLLELPTKPHVVAVTGYGQASDRARAREAGFDLHFVKPVSLRDVHNAIDKFAGQ